MNVSFSSFQQNIVYHEYDVAKNTWSDAKIAVKGESRASRDGMPSIATLKNGGFAMVIETQDYNHRLYKATYGKSVFVASVSLSADGKTWSAPIPVTAPQNIRGGDRCAAPFIASLPDGRIVISYMTEDGFKGTRGKDEVQNCVYAVIISKDVIKADTKLTATKGGISDDFCAINGIFDTPENGYMIWNTVYCDGKYVYFSGGAGANDGSFPSAVRIRRAKIGE